MVITKTDFKTSLDCPVKLRHLRAGLPSKANQNEYLEFFAECGFMVEALAHALHPDAKTPKPERGESLHQATQRLLSVPGDGDWFEATFVHGGMSARVDILRRIDDRYELIEIKAKSYDPEEDATLWAKKGGVKTEWQDYIFDIAFQTLVVKRATGLRVVPYLCVVDKSKTTSQQTIFDKFDLLERGEDRTAPRALFVGDKDALRNDHLLAFLDVSEYVASVEDEVAELASLAVRWEEENSFPEPVLKSACRDCEFRTDPSGASGFVRCWGSDVTDSSHLVDLYYMSSIWDEHELSGLVNRGITSIRDIDPAVIDGSKARGARQLLQIKCQQENREIVLPTLSSTLKDLVEPYFFLDFETSRIPVPYHVGMNPYEQVPFQFSCHVLNSADSNDLYHYEWINCDDVYPASAFVTNLKEVLGESGTVFVWSPFEQTTMKDLLRQDEKYRNLSIENRSWLQELPSSTAEGGRIFDLMRACQAGYCHPLMGGRVSIKSVVKAVWSTYPELWSDPWFSKYFREGPDGMAIDPYLALPDTPSGFFGEEIRVEAVREGVGAMRSYQDMMYGPQRGDQRFRELNKALLLQYCELDTAAMLIIWKYWTRFVSHSS